MCVCVCIRVLSSVMNAVNAHLLITKRSCRRWPFKGLNNTSPLFLPRWDELEVKRGRVLSGKANTTSLTFLFPLNEQAFSSAYNCPASAAPAKLDKPGITSISPPASPPSSVSFLPMLSFIQTLGPMMNHSIQPPAKSALSLDPFFFFPTARSSLTFLLYYWYLF